MQAGAGLAPTPYSASRASIVDGDPNKFSENFWKLGIVPTVNV